MDKELTFKLIPREEQHSDYDWMNIEHGATRVGKVRGRIDGKTVTICSINIFPEFEKHGYGKATIVMFKKHFDTIIADRVRFTAIGFWKMMGFTDEGNGNWKFRSGEGSNRVMELSSGRVAEYSSRQQANE